MSKHPFELLTRGFTPTQPNARHHSCLTSPTDIRHTTFGGAQGENALRTGEWVLSEDSKYEGQDTRVGVEPCNLEGGVFAGDYGLLLDESHKHYAVGASFPKPINNAGKVSLSARLFFFLVFLQRPTGVRFVLTLKCVLAAHACMHA